MLAQFMSAEPAKRLTLADMVMDRIKEKETEIQTVMSGIRREDSEKWGCKKSKMHLTLTLEGHEVQEQSTMPRCGPCLATDMAFCAERTTNMMPSVDAKVAAVYTSVGKLLSSYRSGKVPKAFKVCV